MKENSLTSRDASDLQQRLAELEKAEARWMRAEKALQARNRQLELLNRAGQVFNSTHSLDEILGIILEEVRRLLDVTICSIWLVDREASALVCQQATDPKSELMRGWRLDLGLGLAGWAANTGKSLIVPDAQADPRHFKELDTITGLLTRSVLACPLVVRDDVIGVLEVIDEQADRFEQSLVTLLEPLAASAARSIENARLFQMQREQNKLAEALVSAVAIVNSSLEIDEVLDRILAQVEQVVPGDTFNIMMLEGDWVHIVRSRGYEQVGISGLTPPEAIPLALYPNFLEMIATGKSIVIPDTTAGANWIPKKEQEWRLSYVGTPISLDDTVVGFLNANGTRPGQFNAADAQRLNAFASYAATAIKNARLYHDARQRVAELDMLRRTSLQLTSSLNLSSVLEGIVESALVLVSATDCHIYLYDEKSKAFSFGAALWENGRREPAVAALRSNGLTATVAREGHPIIINDASSNPLYMTPEARKWDVHAVAGFPLMRADRVVGVFTIAFIKPHTFSDDELRVLGLLADQAAIAIENARLVSGLESEVAARTAEIRHEKEKSEAILRSAGESIAMLDLDGRIRYINDAFANLTGYSAEDCIGKHERFMLAEEIPDHVRTARLATLVAGDIWHEEAPVRCRNGRLYDAAFAIAPMHDMDGELVGYVSSHRDVSRQKEIERTRSRFMTLVSHQLRMPVTNIKLYAQMLQHQEPEGKTDRYLRVLCEQADQLGQLVESVLEMTALDSSQTMSSWRPVILSSLIRDAVTRFQELSKAAGLSLMANPLPPELPVVNGDQARLSQALDELMRNAVQFTPAGGQVTISVGVTAGEPRPWVTITVKDSGLGVPSDELDMVFDRFFRGRVAESGHIPGTGLGLSMAQEILRIHGGRVTGDSSGVSGEGSTFTLWLPGAP